MVKYLCSRCGYSTNHRGTFLRHLNRKNICPAHISDMKIATIIEGYNLQKFYNKNEKNNNYKKYKKMGKMGKNIDKNV